MAEMIHIGKLKEELESLSFKINSTYNFESVLKIDNDSNVWCSWLIITMSSVFCSIRARGKIEEDEHSKLIPFKEPIATAYQRVVKGFRSNQLKDGWKLGTKMVWRILKEEICCLIQSQVNNENNEVIRRIYSSTRTKYSWETKLGADFLILVPDGKNRNHEMKQTLLNMQ